MERDCEVDQITASNPSCDLLVIESDMCRSSEVPDGKGV